MVTFFVPCRYSVSSNWSHLSTEHCAKDFHLPTFERQCLKIFSFAIILEDIACFLKKMQGCPYFQPRLYNIDIDRLADRQTDSYLMIRTGIYLLDKYMCRFTLICISTCWYCRLDTRATELSTTVLHQTDWHLCTFLYKMHCCFPSRSALFHFSYLLVTFCV